MYRGAEVIIWFGYRKQEGDGLVAKAILSCSDKFGVLLCNTSLPLPGRHFLAGDLFWWMVIIHSLLYKIGYTIEKSWKSWRIPLSPVN